MLYRAPLKRLSSYERSCGKVCCFFFIFESFAEKRLSQGSTSLLILLYYIQLQQLPIALVSRSDSEGGGTKDEDDIVAPPDIFSGDTCATPTPGDFLLGSGGGDSGTSTPRYLDSPSVESLHGKGSSPLASINLKAEKSGDSPPSPRARSTLVQSTAARGGARKIEHDDGGDQGSSSTDLPPAPVSCDSPSGRMFSIFTSSQHNLKPSNQSHPDEFLEEILDYSLTSLPSTTSIESVSNEPEEGTDM